MIDAHSTHAADRLAGLPRNCRTEIVDADMRRNGTVNVARPMQSPPLATFKHPGSELLFTRHAVGQTHEHKVPQTWDLVEHRLHLLPKVGSGERRQSNQHARA